MPTYTHSKWKHTIIFICGVFLGITLILNTLLFCCLNTPKVKSGQIWKYKGSEVTSLNSPKCKCNIRKVINVEENFVLFVNEKNDTLGMELKNFRHNAVLLSDAK